MRKERWRQGVNWLRHKNKEGKKESAEVRNMRQGNKARNNEEKDREVWHAWVIKMTSVEGASNTFSACEWTLNEDGFQGPWLHTKSKSRGAKDEVQRENQFSPLPSPLPLRERFTGKVMTAHHNDSHILLQQSDNSIHSQSNLAQNKVVICTVRVENCLSSLNVIVLHRVDPLNLLPSEIRDSEDS